MPATLSYPGVYIEEIPSGVRTITGVATSIAAFIGRALTGPVNEAVTINSYADFERRFGGLWVESTLGYAVRDFYLNGGSQAVIVRLYHIDPGNPDANPVVLPPIQKTPITVGTVTLEAAYEGNWGRNLRATVDLNVSPDVAGRLGLIQSDLFNLTVTDSSPGGRTESFLNLSVKPSARRINNVLNAESNLVRWKEGAALPTNTPAAGDDTITTAEKALSLEQKKLADLKKAQPPNDNAIAAQQLKVNDATTAVADAKKALVTSDGLDLTYLDFTSNRAGKKGLYALEQLFALGSLFNILSIPPYTPGGDIDVALVADAASYCEERRAMLLVDPPSTWIDKDKAKADFNSAVDKVGTRSKNAALYFPRLNQPNPLRNNQIEKFVPCGVVAGIFARTDTQRGVWKAPAGLEATLVGVPDLTVKLIDLENGELNQLGINCLRAFPVSGRVLWGARTLRGADQLADEWKYVPVRRTALFIEESLYRGTQWVVFEPNDEPLWAQIRLNIGAFMHSMFRQGAFQGVSPKDAYFVKCDKDTTTQNDINLGIVNIVVGFAPLKPAEFVVIKLQQMAGQIQV